jgi:hypothetical protein
MGPGDYHSGNVPATDAGALPSRKVVRSTIVRVRIEAIPDEGPVEVLEALMALVPLVAAPELMPAMKTGRAIGPVPTIPGQSGYGHRCHC